MEKWLDSREIAEKTNKSHAEILKKIRGDARYTGCINLINIDSIEEYFIKSSYKDKKNESRICYKCTLKGVKMLLDNMRNYKQIGLLYEWYNNNIKIECSPVLYDRKEIKFIDLLEKILEPFSLRGIRQYTVLNYRIDYYIPSLNIAIEYDENGHLNYTYDKHEGRQEEIKKELGCKFIRVTDKYSDEYNVGLVLKEITMFKIMNK